MRRLPVYLLLDTSGSMKGEPIEAVKVGVRVLVSSLRQDPFALESVYLSVMTFDREVKVITSLEDLVSFQVPDIEAPDTGPTHLGAALELLCQQYDKEIKKTSSAEKGDWKPLLFIMTDGCPSDLQKYRLMIPEVKRRRFGNIVACAAGPKAKSEYLSELTDHVVSLDIVNQAAFTQFFKWVSASISMETKNQGTAGAIEFPPPPPEVHPVAL